ncbi:alkaline phosphatase D family protein [Methylibium sp.]|uniref:alkaline phosphatase D family protein n=1 Tax=Methylibium sp. TaxID=2067992 RepID=UPI003D0D72F5
MQRRDLLAHLGRSAATLALGTLFTPGAGRSGERVERLPGGDDPFTLGVASGMPAPDGVVLWTRLAPRPREPLGGLPDAAIAVRWELAEDERFSIGRHTGVAWARPEHAHSVHVDVDGLPSDRRYFYRFHAGEATSPVGRTRTAPAPDAVVNRLRIALASCQHYEQGEFTLHREIASRDLDFVLFVGDYVYESSNARLRVRPHEALQPTTLEGFRQRHVTYKLDAALRAAHAAHPWVLTWDDHEVENDYAGAASRDPSRTAADFLQLRAAAYKAYFEHMPVSPRSAPVGADMRIHEHYPWGRLADLWTLDNRQYRSLQPCNPEGIAGGRLLTQCATLEDDAATVFGAVQERWIGEQLAASQRGWRLLAQGTQIAPGGIDTPLGRSIFSDGWDGYPKARARLLRAIAEQPQGNVVCLGGDVHRHVVARLRADPSDPRSAVVASEFATSSLTSRGLSDTATALMRSSNPDLLHARSDERGYVLLDLTPQRLRAELRATAFPVAADAQVHTQARFVVEQGHPAPQSDA